MILIYVFLHSHDHNMYMLDNSIIWDIDVTFIYSKQISV